jgi:predicted N-acetyltransferase YhbS
MVGPSMNNIGIFDIPYPSPSERVFDKMLWTDWYDGITGAIVAQTRFAVAF